MNDISTEAPTGGPEIPSCPKPVGRPRRILVVEDDESISRLNIMALGQAGYHVDAAANGAMAWEILQLNSYDLIVTDNNMPVLTGVELLKKVRRAGMTLPVVMVTACYPKEDLDENPWMQLDAAILKPFTKVELLETVQTVLQWASVNRSETRSP